MRILVLDRDPACEPFDVRESMPDLYAQLCEDGHELLAVADADIAAIPTLRPRRWPARLFADRRYASAVREAAGREPFDLAWVVATADTATLRAAVSLAQSMPVVVFAGAAEPERSLHLRRPLGGKSQELFRLSGELVRTAAVTIAPSHSVAETLRSRPGCRNAADVRVIPALAAKTCEPAEAHAAFRVLWAGDDGVDELMNRTQSCDAPSDTTAIAHLRTRIDAGAYSLIGSADLVVIADDPETRGICDSTLLATAVESGVPVLCVTDDDSAAGELIDEFALGYTARNRPDEIAITIAAAAADRLTDDERDELAERASDAFGPRAVLDAWSSLVTEIEATICSRGVRRRAA